MKYRILKNKNSGHFAIQKKHLLWWLFEEVDVGVDIGLTLTFPTFAEAKDYVERKQRPYEKKWEVVE